MTTPRLLASVILFSLVPALWAQESGQVDPASYVGMSISDLLGRLGTPASVYAVRGPEEWLDDVVFIYSEGDFYILKDRVWQVSVKTAYRIRVGDPESAAFLGLGEASVSSKEHAVFPLGWVNWPLAVRCNFNAAGRVSAIFIYRTDL